MAIKRIKKIKFSESERLLRREILKEIKQKELGGEAVGSYGFDRSDPLQKVKWSLCREILIAKRILKLSAKDVSIIIGLDKARTSEIMHYKFNNFTIDRLLGCFLCFKTLNDEIDERINDILLAFYKGTEAC